MSHQKRILERVNVKRFVSNLWIVPFVFAIVFMLFSLQRTINYYASRIVNEIWQPVLVCNQTVYDFGKINVTVNPNHSFIVENAGKKNLFIERVDPGCGACIKVIEYTKSPVRPQKTGSINIKLLTQNLFGKISKEVLVKTNDPKNPNLILTLEAEVIRPEMENATKNTKEFNIGASTQSVSTIP
jgi:hypothetical protein